MKTVHYVLKGTNCLTEMYSAIAADVPIPGDSSTQKNPLMMREFTSAKRVSNDDYIYSISSPLMCILIVFIP